MLFLKALSTNIEFNQLLNAIFLTTVIAESYREKISVSPVCKYLVKWRGFHKYMLENRDIPVGETTNSFP